jgi:hypothetical protein
MTRQPTPTVTDADVERIVRRDFPTAIFDDVLAMLHEFGTEQWEREAPRVRLAALKLAAGDIKGLRYAIGLAKCDYRDVLAQAEYPSYIKHVPPTGRLSAAEVQKIINADWNQYHDWLTR